MCKCLCVMYYKDLAIYYQVMFLCLSLYNFIFQVPGFPLWFNVKYDEDDAIYTFKLQEDVERGDLQILTL